MYAAKELRNAVIAKGYAWFDNSAPYNLNIVGVRSPNREAGAFDDHICVVYREKHGGPYVVKQYAATTDPGVYWLENPSRVEGTAILKPGQYRGSHVIGFHNGRYKALVQTGNKVTVYRDNNRDRKLDTEGVLEMSGFFGINVHKSSDWSVSVGKWSAGCQVFHKDADFAEFMDLVEVSARYYGNRFTYTLLCAEDVPNYK